MRLDIVNRIQYKYKNNIIKELPELIIDFLHKNLNYQPLFESKNINVEDILYFLRNKHYKNRKELLELVLIYVEMKHGIFDRVKRFTATSSNNKI